MERKGLFLILAVVLMISCSKNTESVFRITEFTIEPGGTSPPFKCDVRHFVGVDTTVSPAETTWIYYEDEASAHLEFVVSFNDPSGVPITGYAAYVIRYRVSFERTDGGTEVPETHEGGLCQTIKSGDAPTPVNFVLVPVDAKLMPPLSALADTSFVIRTKAIVEFWATEVKSGSELHATGEIQVNFADWIDKK